MRILSGIQPSGELHIGHYVGAMKQWIELQNTNEAIFCIVDMHAITVPQKSEELRRRIFDLTALYLAIGIDPQKSIIFQQSCVPAHAELQWILNTITPLGELERMTQYKIKNQESGIRNQGTLAGLLNYPTLMASDILLYQTDEVPVGEDQLQHIEFTRMLADKFNKRFGTAFKIPKPRIAKEGARIMSLQDPLKKMSKSDPNPDASILLLDDRVTIAKKLKSAITDSGKKIAHNPKQKPAISNLMVIYGVFSGTTFKEIETEYKGKTYNEFKNTLAEIISDALLPIQERFNSLRGNPDEVRAVLEEGKERAMAIAEKTLKDVHQKIGFTI